MNDLSALPQWKQAMSQLRALHDHHGAEAQQGSQVSERYQGCRAAMVVEVVASSQRRYETVSAMVEAFARTPSATSTLAVARTLDTRTLGCASKRT